MNSKLCPDLQFICDFELAHGNVVSHIEEPAGTSCEYAVVFTEPLRIVGTAKSEELPPFVTHWESRDPHYPVEAGFFCTKHRHSVAGPIAR